MRGGKRKRDGDCKQETRLIYSVRDIYEFEFWQKYLKQGIRLKLLKVLVLTREMSLLTLHAGT